MSRQERFTRSKCDRCGRATRPQQNGEHDLYTLGDYPGPLKDLGDFCLRCCEMYTIIQWLVWFDMHAHLYDWYDAANYTDLPPLNMESITA